MPGLYSSNAQLMLLISLYLRNNRGIDGLSFLKFIKRAKEIPEESSVFFRHPGPAERAFMEKIAGRESPDLKFSYPGAETAVILTPLALLCPGENSILLNVLEGALIFNRDIDSIAGTIVFITLIREIVDGRCPDTDDPLLFAENVAGALLSGIEKNTGGIFDKGINPDSLYNSVVKYQKIFTRLTAFGNDREAEDFICSFVNEDLKNPVTRATVNHPPAIIPYSVFLVHSNLENPEDILFFAAQEGGSAAILCALTGALSGALFGRGFIPEELMEGLVNKKRILGVINDISAQKTSGDILNDFSSAELSLSEKENQELEAKLKRNRTKPKKKKSPKDREREITGHVVESWTKMDQAKWRKKLDKEKSLQ